MARSKPTPQPAGRTGATRMADVPPELVAQLNAGVIEARTLTESLVVDFGVLLHAVAPDLPPAAHAEMAEASVPERRLGILLRMKMAGRFLAQAYGSAVLTRLAAHPSDTVRGWSAFAAMELQGVALAERLDQIRPLADDSNSGVREWAWMALRPHLAADLPTALALFEPWVLDPSFRIRRFAVEATRPRGVWAAHLTDLKADPSPGLPLLEPLMAEPERYVQDSVANWLNDAAKSRPDWVTELCARWTRTSPAQETAYIVKRALRSL